MQNRDKVFTMKWIALAITTAIMSAPVWAVDRAPQEGVVVGENTQVDLIDADIQTTQDHVAGISASHNGAKVTMTGGQITTKGAYARGADIFSGAVAKFTDAAISTSGNSASAVKVTNVAGYNPSSVSITGGSLNTSGVNSHALEAANGATATADAVRIHTTGDAARGIYAHNGAQVDINNSTIITEGNRTAIAGGAAGVSAETDAIINVNNTTIMTSGINGDGLNATGGGQITMNGGAIDIQGNETKAAVAYGGNGHITMNDVQITGSGDLLRGVMAAGSTATTQATLAMNGGSIALNGNKSSGAEAISNGAVSLQAVTIKVSGAESNGLRVASKGSISGDNLQIQTQGTNTHGVQLMGGNVTLQNSLVNSSGDLSNAIKFNGDSSVMNASNSHFYSEDAAAIRAYKANGTLNLDNSTVSSGAGILLSNNETSTTVINAVNNSVLLGDAINAEGGTAIINLDQSVWQGNATNISEVNATNGSMWNVSDDSSVGKLTLDHSTLYFAPSSVGKVVTVAGDYHGNDGNIVFNTVLGDDDSLTNKLIVGGDTSGNTNVSVINAGGIGAKTLNGIELIQVNGDSAGEFTQQGRIVAGAYDYHLARGEGENASNWYLSNTDPSLPEKDKEQIAVVRPEAGEYASNMAAANNLFALRLQDRLGETHYVDALGQPQVTSLWLRSVGGHTRSSDSTGQLKTQANRYVMQLGGDIAQWSTDGQDRFHLGLMAGYGNQQSKTLSRITGHSATGSIDGYSAGIYGTWLQDNAEKTGAYIDSWAQYNWFNNQVSGSDAGSNSYRSSGITASVEGGYTWKLGEKNDHESYYLQPKAQVTWMGVKTNNFTEDNGTQVSGNGDGNLQTRLGVRAFIKGHNAIDNGKQRTFEPFVEANWIHNTQSFGATLNGEQIHQAGTENIGELKVGVESQINPNLNLWGNVAQQVGSKSYSDSSAMVGVKVNF